MAFLEKEFPLEIKISFVKLVEEYTKHLEGDDTLLQKRAQRVIDITNQNPADRKSVV